MKRTLFIALSVGISLLFLASNVQAQQAKKITLAGYKHNPPVQTSGSGMATVELHGDTLTIKGKFENLNGNYSGAYLMVSLRGQGGNQLYRLKTTLDENDKTSGRFISKENQFVLSPAEKKLLKDGDLYINISSFENRKGELRGNIGPLGK